MVVSLDQTAGTLLVLHDILKETTRDSLSLVSELTQQREVPAVDPSTSCSV